MTKKGGGESSCFTYTNLFKGVVEQAQPLWPNQTLTLVYSHHITIHISLHLNIDHFLAFIQVFLHLFIP
jgi:hypothetical protein